MHTAIIYVMLLQASSVAAAQLAQAPVPDITIKRIERDIHYLSPLLPCELPAIVARIATATRTPAGVEHLPGDCPRPPAPPGTPPPVRERVFLSGMTIAAALDALVALDLRYAWRALDGVMVVRPVQAWGDREHFLHRVLPRLSVADAHLGAALHDWTAALFPQSRLVSDELRSAPMRTAEGNRTFSFVVSDTPAILALDELARAHGAVRWEVRYCTQVVHPRVATVWLWTLEDDPTGMGKPMPGRFSTVDGKQVDACQGKM